MPDSIPLVTVRPLSSSAAEDLLNGLIHWELWGRLGWLEVKRRYRRTALGPFWSGISYGLFVGAFGVVGSGVLRQSAGEFTPFLAAGMLVWLLISAMVSEAGTVFVATSNVLRQIRLSYSVLVYALVWRNLLVFLHNLVVFLGVLLLASNQRPTLTMLLAIPGLFLLLLNGTWLTLLMGMLCTRFRDMQQVAINVLQIFMFITPIFWSPDLLAGTGREVIVRFNPIYYLIDIVRTPLLSGVPAPRSYEVVLAITALGWIATLMAFRRFRARIPYWA